MPPTCSICPPAPPSSARWGLRSLLRLWPRGSVAGRPGDARSSLRRWPPAPVPWFVGNALAIASRVRQAKSELGRVVPEPSKLPRARKRDLQLDVVRRAKVERTAGMVLAAAGHRAHPEDGCDAISAGKFAPDDRGLACDAPEGRQREQGDTFRDGSGPHPPPGRGGARRHPQDPAIVRGPPNRYQALRFRLQTPFS